MMGSKRNKKAKQEEPQEPAEIEIMEKPNKSHKRKRQLEEEVLEVKQEINLEIPVKPKKKKRKNKDESVASETNEENITTSNSELEKEDGIIILENLKLESVEPSQEMNDGAPPKKKKKNKDHELALSTKANQDVSILTNGIAKSEPLKEEELGIHSIEDIKIDCMEPPQEVDDQHKEIIMPQNDMMELLRRIEILLPENDNLSYKCRADKLPWDDIAFSTYTAKECKETWNHIHKGVRRYRILKEVLDDARTLVQNPPKSKKKDRYPGMPQKPPTGYNLFYRKKKPGLLADNPGLDIAEISKQISQMFKNLSSEKKAKYEKQAAQLKIKYEEDLQVFYEEHPELAECIRKEKMAENKPLKPSTPFLLYYKNQLRKNGNADNHDLDNAFKEQCKVQWKQLSMKKKIMWITKAEQDVIRYENEMKEYVAKHPNFNHVPIKSILTKDEKALKDRYSGKPDKPPTSAYSLFSRNLLQSEDIKKIAGKDRMNHIATLWKNCTEEEKNNYKAKVDELMEQYKKDYEKYIESLPEEKRQLELQKNMPKKKSKPETDKKKKAKGKMEKIPEPATPPISAFSYFATSKNFEDRKVAKKEWKKLSDEGRSEYEKKLVEIKREYILQFEKFLNSLAKEELEEYSRTKQELKYSSEDFVDEDDESTSSSSNYDDDSEDDE